MTASLTPLRSPWRRTGLALLILSPVLLAVAVAVAVAVFALGDLAAVGDGSTEAGLARIGDDLALVIVTEDASAAARARTLIASWGLVTPAVVLIGASVISWWLSGMVQRMVDAAELHVETAEQERESRLAEVVHELRTPLAVMGTNLELAGSGKYVEAARRAVGRMARTVDDLAGHGQLAVEQGDEAVDLGAIAEEIAAEHAGPCRALGIRVVLAGTGSVTVDRVDAAAARIAIGNFMSNAMRQSPRGAAVSIDWGEVEGWGWLAVSDEGAGLAPHLHARVFERGWQGHHARDRNEGAGLGLTIARQLTEAQGGAVTLVSEEGGGAVFSIWLPVELDADRNSVVAPDQVHPQLSPWERVASAV